MSENAPFSCLGGSLSPLLPLLDEDEYKPVQERRRRVSFHSRTSVQLIHRRAHARSLPAPASPLPLPQIEEHLNDEPSPIFPPLLSPSESPCRRRTARFIGFSSSDSGEFHPEETLEQSAASVGSASSSNMSFTANAWKLNPPESPKPEFRRRRLSGSSDNDSTARIFLDVATSPLRRRENVSVEEGSQVMEEVTASPSQESSETRFFPQDNDHCIHNITAQVTLQELIAADQQQDINDASSLEMDSSPSNASSSDDDGDSFSCFETTGDILCFSRSPSADNSWDNAPSSPAPTDCSVPAGSPSSSSSSSTYKEEHTFEEFLEGAQMSFNLFNRSSRKVSLGFPSDSLTTLLSRCVDSDPSLSTTQLFFKARMIENASETRQRLSKSLRTKCLSIHSLGNELQTDTGSTWSSLEVEEYTVRRKLQMIQRAAVMRAKIEWNAQLAEMQKEHQNYLIDLARSLHTISKGLEKTVLSKPEGCCSLPPSPLEKVTRASPARKQREVQDQLEKLSDDLDVMHGLIPWKLAKSVRSKKSHSFILRFGQGYELSLVCNRSSSVPSEGLVSAMFYKSNLEHSESFPLQRDAWSEKEEHILQFIMSKCLLVQRQNRLGNISGLLWDFTCRLTRTVEFLTSLRRHLKEERLTCNQIEYKANNSSPNSLSQGLFTLHLHCTERKGIFTPSQRTIEWRLNLLTNATSRKDLPHSGGSPPITGRRPLRRVQIGSK